MNYQEHLHKLRQKILTELRQILINTNHFEITCPMLNTSWSPVIYINEDSDYNYDPFTLSKIKILASTIYFEASNSSSSLTWSEDTIGIEALAEVLDYVRRNLY